jgi:NAD(P)-dependent dehydrogenase (short-subunit alcohol dehydrogenase family)
MMNGANEVGGMDDLFAVNFRSVVAVCDLARRCMRDGAIVVVGSSSAMKGRENFPLYSASKAAVNNFVEGIAPGLFRECGVRINCVNPGATNTRMIASGVATNKDPLEPEDVAGIIVACTQPTETGQIINIRKYMRAAAAETAPQSHVA